MLDVFFDDTTINSDASHEHTYQENVNKLQYLEFPVQNIYMSCTLYKSYLNKVSGLGCPKGIKTPCRKMVILFLQTDE